MSAAQTPRVAVIGAGGMGRFHAETLRALPGIELAAVCDPYPSPELEQLGVPIMTDPAACAAEGFEGVVIASPDETHAELTLAALDAGSRVLCEKPLSSDLEGARWVTDVELAEGKRRIQLGFMRAYDPAHVAVADRLAGLGNLHLLRCSHRNTNAEARTPETVIINSLIHDIHTVHWLAGDVVDVDARVVTRPGGLLHVLLIMRLVTGGTAIVEFSDDTYAYEVEVEATLDGGMITSSAPQRPRLRIDGDHRTPIGTDWFGWFVDAYRIQDRAWAASLTAPEAIGPSAWDGLAAQIVAEAAIDSIETGGPVGVTRLERPPMYEARW